MEREATLRLNYLLRLQFVWWDTRTCCSDKLWMPLCWKWCPSQGRVGLQTILFMLKTFASFTWQEKLLFLFKVHWRNGSGHMCNLYQLILHPGSWWRPSHILTFKGSESWWGGYCEFLGSSDFFIILQWAFPKCSPIPCESVLFLHMITYENVKRSSEYFYQEN